MDSNKVDAYASWSHYGQHLAPIWDALPEDSRGAFLRPPQRPSHVGGPILVASLHDLRKVRPRPVILVEHGAGQTYVDNRTPAGYAGGPGRGTVMLFLCPTERVADLNRRAYPQAKTELVGSPWVEWLRLLTWENRTERREPCSAAPAFSFHWDCRVSPESRSAWGAYQDLPTHIDMRRVLGHGHPRMWPQLSRWWETVGAEPVESFAEVALRATAYVCDNSSTIYEAAALDIPVVLMNAPWYRRDVHHGLRFWEELPGPMVNNASEIPRALEQAAEWYPDRQDTTERIYGQIEGSAKRAAAAILELLA